MLQFSKHGCRTFRAGLLVAKGRLPRLARGVHGEDAHRQMGAFPGCAGSKDRHLPFSVSMLLFCLLWLPVVLIFALHLQGHLLISQLFADTNCCLLDLPTCVQLLLARSVVSWFIVFLLYSF